jgi:glycosyltransferase involved in cell wall biosynthesis
MKVIVAHAERQHSFFLATAMKQAGILDKYITTIYDRPQSLTNRVKRLLKGNTLKKANSRHCDALDDTDVVQINEFFNLIITALSRFPVLRDVCRKLRNYNGRSFGIKVAKYAIKHNVDAVIMFDGYAYTCFEYLKKNAPNIKCILDVTIMSRPFTRTVFDEIAKKTDDSNLKKENFYLYDERFLKNYQKEYDYGDFFLVGSQIVKKSVEFCGIDESVIAVNPYGVDIRKFYAIPKETVSAPLKLIVVGQLNRRKGIHQLLEVVAKYSADEVVLDLAGGYEATSDIYLKYKDYENIRFHGFVTHDVLYKMYQESHVFVLPSFAEGMALVGLEALASGLPLLCSDCTGINDLVVPYENGIVTRAGEIEDIIDGIDWFLKNLYKIPEMSIKARDMAEKYSWEAYYKRTIQYVNDFLEN